MAGVDELIKVLRQTRAAKGAELAARLHISQAQLSRLIQEAGDRVCKMGLARATRYAATRSLPNLGTHLVVRRIDPSGAVQPHAKLDLLHDGAHWLVDEQGNGTPFVGLPPFAHDMAPQGFLGRTFTQRYPDLGLPPLLRQWTDDNILIALARRGEDCVGDLIIGDESLNRWLAMELRPVTRAQYPTLARTAISELTASSPGGEYPKFAVFAGDRHVLVKFALGDTSAAAQRARDLLICESIALATVRDAGIPAATASCFQIDGDQFLEVERFDRVGARGRVGVLSLFAINAEYVGAAGVWADMAPRLLEQSLIDAADARRLRWLDTFGAQIANTDRHAGNITFFVAPGDEPYRLAPVYDMLPMNFAPVGTNLVERPFQPVPPRADTLDLWGDATHWALQYWQRLIDCDALSADFLEVCARSRAELERLAERFPT